MKKIFKILAISLIVIAVPIIGFAVLVYATAFSDWWLKFPEPQRSQIALQYLEDSGSGITCRDNCVGGKLFYRQMILSQLEKRGYDSGVGELMLKHISWESKSADYRGELIGLIRYNEDKKKEKDPNYVIKIPAKLMEYLNKNGGNANVKSQILVNFPEEAAASDAFISDLLSIAQDKTKGFEERMQAMTDLDNIMNDHSGTDEDPIPMHKSIDYAAVCDIFLTMAEKENGKKPEELSFRKHILSSMYECLMYKDAYKEEYFNRLKNIFYEEGIHPGIQEELIIEFSQFKKVNLNKTNELMLAINNNKELNVIIRRSAGRILDENGVAHETVNLPDGQVNDLLKKLDFYDN